MKRLLIVVVALSLLVAVGGPAIAAKKKQPIKFETSITLVLERGGQGDQYTPPGKARFSGKVTAEAAGGFCTRGREVYVHLKGKGEVGATLNTDRQGNYSFVVDEPVPDEEYRARAQKKVKPGSPEKWKRGKKIVCRAGRSNIIVVP